MQRRSGKIVIELTLSGGERLRKELVALGPAGEKALKRLDRATKSTAPGFKFLDSSVKELKGSLGDLETRAGPFGRVLGSLGPAGKFAALGIGAITVAGASALRVALQATEAFDKMAKSADDLGVTTDTFQALKAASEQASVGFEQTEASLRQFTRASAEAATGRGELSEKLKNSHPELLKSIQLETTMEGKLNAVAKALGRATTEQERTLIATAAFGESGRSMIRVLGDQENAVEGLILQAKAMGLVIDEEILRKSEAMQTELSIASQVIDVQLKSAFVDLAPFIVTATQKLAGFTKALSTGLSAAREFFSELKAKGSIDIGDTFGIAIAQDGLGRETDKLDALLDKRDKIQARGARLTDSAFGNGAFSGLAKLGVDVVERQLKAVDYQINQSRARLTELNADLDTALNGTTDAPSGSPPRPDNDNDDGIIDYTASLNAAAAAARKRAEEERLLAKIIADSLTPQERYTEELEKLNAIRNRLSDGQYQGALQQLQVTRDASIAQLDKEARLQERAAALTSALGAAIHDVVTPQEAYNNALRDLNELKPYLSTDAYAASLKTLKADLEAATQAERDRQQFIAESQSVRESLMTDQERLNAEIERLGTLRSKAKQDGGLTDDEYAEAVKKAREEFDKLNREGEDHIDILRRMNDGLGQNVTSWKDFGRLALQVLVDIGLQALQTRNSVGALGGIGSSGGILNAIGGGIASALGVQSAGRSGTGAQTAGATTSKLSGVAIAGAAMAASAAINGNNRQTVSQVNQSASAYQSGAGTVVNFTVVDKVGVGVKTEQRQNASGQTELLLTLDKQIEKANIRSIRNPAWQREFRQVYAMQPKIGAR